MAELRARKRFGQNFLVAGPTIAKIVGLINPQAGEHIIEVGPGRGALTFPMADSGAHVYAVEIDRDLVAYLREQSSERDNVTIIEGDFLAYEPPDDFKRFVLVGNLPYNITSPTVDWCVRYHERIERIVFMVQAELAARLCGKPGSKDWSPLSIFTQMLFDVKQCFKVGPGNFRPQPKVQSAIITLTPRGEDGITPTPEMDRVVRTAFKHRRKMLVNNLTQEIVPDHDIAVEVLGEIGLKASCRAEELTIDQFLTLTELLRARKLV